MLPNGGCLLLCDRVERMDRVEKQRQVYGLHHMSMLGHP